MRDNSKVARPWTTPIWRIALRIFRVTNTANVLGLSASGGFLTAPFDFGTARISGDLPFVSGPQPSVDWGAAPPVAGTFAAGSIRHNIAPSAGGVPGWRCVTAGTPGTWKAIPALQA